MEVENIGFEQDRIILLVNNGPHIEIVKTPEGFVVDAYTRKTGKNISTMTIRNDDLKEG